ncbi:MAG TPA: hypothetical protein VF516_03240 [Kofleriaceae bacterium]
MANSKAVGVAYSDPQFDSVGVTGNVTISGNALLGDAATDLVGVHGSTGTSQATFVATFSVVAVSVSGVIGFSSSGAFSNAMTLLNALQTLLVAHGFMASS